MNVLVNQRLHVELVEVLPELLHIMQLLKNHHHHIIDRSDTSFSTQDLTVYILYVVEHVYRYIYIHVVSDVQDCPKLSQVHSSMSQPSSRFR